MTPSLLPRCAGLEAGSDRLTLYVHSPDTVKQLLLPPSFMRRFPNLQIRTDLVDMQVGGVFSSNVAGSGACSVPVAWVLHYEAAAARPPDSMDACFAVRLLFALAARNRNLSALRACWTPLLVFLHTPGRCMCSASRRCCHPVTRPSVCLHLLFHVWHRCMCSTAPRSRRCCQPTRS